MYDPSTQRRSRGTTPSPTSEALLDAARTAVREHGLTATSRDIADRAGANLASITYYFGSKDELIAEALFGELERLTSSAFVQLERNEVDPITRLGAALAELLATFDAAQGDAAVTLHALLLASGASSLAPRGRQTVETLVERLSRVIAELRDGGSIQPWVDPRAMASMLAAAASGMVLQRQLEPDGPTLQAMAGQLAGLLLAAGRPSHVGDAHAGGE